MRFVAMVTVLLATGCAVAPCGDGRDDCQPASTPDVRRRGTPDTFPGVPRSEKAVCVPGEGLDWGSVRWILSQPAGELCGGGAQATDWSSSKLFEHPENGLCTFRCDGAEEGACGALGGECDGAGLCVSVDACL